MKFPCVCARAFFFTLCARKDAQTPIARHVHDVLGVRTLPARLSACVRPKPVPPNDDDAQIDDEDGHCGSRDGPSDEGATRARRRRQVDDASTRVALVLSKRAATGRRR